MVKDSELNDKFLYVTNMTKKDQKNVVIYQLIE